MKKSLKNIWSVLNSSQRKESYLIFTLLILGMLIETLSIGLFFPVISILFKIGNASSDLLEKFSSAFFAEISHEKLVVFSLLLLLAVYLLKNLFLTLIAKIEIKKIIDIKLKTAERLYSNFLLNPFSFHLKNNSSKLINYNIDQIDSFGNSLYNCINLFAEILIVIGIVSILFVFEPRSTLLILFLAIVFGLTFFLSFYKKISFLSEKRLENRSLKIRDLQEGFGSIKEIKIYNKENFFIDTFKKHNRAVFDIEAFEDFIKRLPRLWFEFLCILVFISTLIFLTIYYDYDILKITPVLGLFGAASIRLIPSINRIIVAIQSINFGQAAINMIYENFKTQGQKKRDIKQVLTRKLKDKIILKNLNFSYDGDKNIIENINMEIKKGDFIGIFGETGSGKTTLLNLLLGLIVPTKGQILIDDNNIMENISNWQAQIGFVPQSIYLLDDTVKKNVAFGIIEDKINLKSLDEAINNSELDKFISSLEKNLETNVGERGARISGGQLQRVGIARALYKNSEILIFDEATSSLDTETEEKLMETINKIKNNKTIIFVSHKKKPMMYCNKLYELKDNKLLFREKI